MQAGSPMVLKQFAHCESDDFRLVAAAKRVSGLFDHRNDVRPFDSDYVAVATFILEH